MRRIGKGWRDDRLTRDISELGLAECVQLTGYVADDMLPALYSGAYVFVYPSLYEGFGLPVLEAMACGVPIITRNVSSLPEVAGEAVLLIDPEGVDQLAPAIQTLLDALGHQQRLRGAGLMRAHKFSSRCAYNTMNVYRAALGQTNFKN